MSGQSFSDSSFNSRSPQALSPVTFDPQGSNECTNSSMNSSFDKSYQTLGGNISPSCEIQQYNSDYSCQAMQQNYELVPGPYGSNQMSSYSQQNGNLQTRSHLVPSPEFGYRGGNGEMPASPSAHSENSSVTGVEVISAPWGGAPHMQQGSPGAPAVHPMFPNDTLQYAPVQNNPQHPQHCLPTTSEHQQVPTQQTMLHSYGACSPGQFVTVPAQHSCHTGAFDASAFPGFVMGHNNSLKPENVKPKRKRIINKVQRKAANIRERKRMYNLNTAFDVLRTQVPKFSYEKKLSRIETLRLAITYISFMTDVLHGKDPTEVKLPQVKRFDFSGMGLTF